MDFRLSCFVSMGNCTLRRQEGSWMYKELKKCVLVRGSLANRWWLELCVLLRLLRKYKLGKERGLEQRANSLRYLLYFSLILLLFNKEMILKFVPNYSCQVISTKNKNKKNKTTKTKTKNRKPLKQTFYLQVTVQLWAILNHMRFYIFLRSIVVWIFSTSDYKRGKCFHKYFR